jgi:transcriptional regulator with XRE-family HTH domain
VARSALARYERGDRYPSVPEFRRLCEALSVAPEYLIYGDSSPGFTPTESPIAAIAPSGETEEAQVARHVLTGILIGALPKSEADAFRELIWASASQHLKDQPEVLVGIAKLCQALADNLWPEMDQLLDDKLRTDPKFKEFVESLSDEASDSS